MNAVIDLGNTNAKVGWFEADILVNTQRIAFADLLSSINQASPQRVIIATVNQQVDSLRDDIVGEVLLLDHTTPLPIKLNYKTPATLGRDRIAGVVGASILHPKSNNLVIDIGTCITYDIVDDAGCYHGGAISPGVEMKFKALNTFTANLPLIVSADADLIGDTTETSIQSGVINGTMAEIEEIIRMYSDKFSHLRIIMCGGGAKFFETKMKTPVEVCEELVLIGLNGILKHNA